MRRLIDNEKAYRTLAIWSDGGRLPHAVLVEGEKGSGRRSFALQMAQAILCEGEKRPCGECRHCVKVEKGIHPDIAIYSGGEGTRSFHIDTVREIRAATAVRPNEADARVFLLLDVQNMSVQAQNALLKTIEEPVKGVHFLFTCENREQMLPTIRSRVMSVMLETPAAERCAEILPELFPGKDPEKYQAASVESAGNIGTALSLLANGENGAYTQAKETLLYLLEGRELEALASLRAFERDRDGFAAYLRLMRTVAAQLFTGTMEPLPAINSLQLSQIIAIMDEMDAALGFNANMLLLTTILCAKIRRVVTGG